MKVQTVALDEIERIGINNEQEFTINFDAKMAKILADGLYSDKIQSVIRELSCNAWDSHVEAGKGTTPIQIHFPSTLEPWFHVRDFGMGLSHDQVMSIYTTYGASTKTNSNDVIGQLGLGSKSPFSLTNAFDVSARKDGVENHYSMFRDERGMPRVAHLGSKPTSECNGVTVRVPIRAEQRRDFMEKAREVYKWFPVKPDFMGADIKLETIKYEYGGDDWGIIAPVADRYGNRSYHHRAVALMGLVAYPLDFGAIKDVIPGFRELFQIPTVLKFDIGDLEVAANREALGYDDRTCANIVAKLKKMVAELGARFEHEIASAKTLWEAKAKFGEIFNSGQYGNNGYGYEYSQIFRNVGLKWNGQPIKDTNMRVRADALYPRVKSTTAGAPDTVDSMIWDCGYHYKRPRLRHLSADSSLNLNCEPRTVIIFNDLERGGLGRIHEFNRSTNFHKVITVFGPSTKVGWPKMRKLLGEPEVIMASALPKPEKEKKARTHMLMWTGGVAGAMKAWKQVELDLNDGGFYVELKGWNVMNGEKEASLDGYLSMAKHCKIIPPDANVYAMRQANREVVRKHKDWIELFGYIKSQLEDRIKKNNLGQIIADHDEYNKLSGTFPWSFWNGQLTTAGLRDQTGLMATFLREVGEIKTSINGLANDSIKDLASRFDIALQAAKPRYSLVNKLKEIDQRYPMLGYLGKGYGNPGPSDIARAAEYVNFVDTCAVFYAMQDQSTK